MANNFDINTKEVVQLTNKLEKIHRSAMPVAVRQTLNDAAFLAKTDYVEKEFDKQFIVKKRNFIKSHTVVNKSPNTFNVNQMASEMGVVKGKSQAGDELDTQEYGGTVKKRDYIPTPKARVSKSPRKLISRPNYRVKMKQRNKRPKKNYEEFSKAAYYWGKNAIILFKKTLVKIKSIATDGKITFINLYSYKSGRSISIKRKPFIGPSGVKAAKHIPDLFYKNGQKQINRILSK